tara:strand:+ start:379 stop:1398 length:1020 start_codon:yes stop_codon:yes gene_type:complete
MSYLGNLENDNALRIQRSMEAIDAFEKEKQTELSDFKTKLDKTEPDPESSIEAETGFSPDALQSIKTGVRIGENVNTLRGITLAKNAANLAKTGKSSATAAAEIYLKGPLSYSDRAAQLAKSAKSGATTVGKVLTMSSKDGATALKSAVAGQEAATEGTELTDFASGSSSAAKTGLSTTEGVVNLTKDGVEAAGEIGAGRALLGAAGGLASVATGGLAALSDVKRFEAGARGTAILGDNKLEKWGNALELGGSALAFVPGAEIFGGIGAAVGGILDFFGEREKGPDKSKQLAEKAAALSQEKLAAGTIALQGVKSVGQGSLGQLSNVSKSSLIGNSGGF